LLQNPVEKAEVNDYDKREKARPLPGRLINDYPDPEVDDTLLMTSQFLAKNQA